MIKTIKVEKQMHIGELLEYVRKNELRGRYFRVMNESRYIKITPGGVIYFDADFCFRPDDTFTVEVEEPITEDTVFEDITVVFKINSRDETGHFYNSTLKDIKKAKNLLSAYIPIDGKLQLIWEAE